VIHKLTPLLRREPANGQPEPPSESELITGTPAPARVDKIKVADLK
jgi:hypothetical protein